jgi:hypothetical protein
MIIFNPRHSTRMVIKRADHLWVGIDTSSIHLATEVTTLQLPVSQDANQEREKMFADTCGRSVCLCRERAGRLPTGGGGIEEQDKPDMRVEVVYTSKSSKARWRSKPRRRPLDQHTLILASVTSDGLKKLANAVP